MVPMTRDQDETTGARTELEKLDAGLEYCFDDPEVAARKQAEDEFYAGRDPATGGLRD